MIKQFDFSIHINAFLRMTINKAITWQSHAHMYCDQEYSSVFVSRKKQVCLQARLKWWQWWGTPDIIWNRVPNRRRSRGKWTITKCCLTAWLWRAMAFYAACQWHMMVQCCYCSGSTNKLFCMCFLFWQEANELIFGVW